MPTGNEFTLRATKPAMRPTITPLNVDPITMPTISGAEVLKKRRPGFKAIAVEPETSPVITQKMGGQDLKPGRHKIQGIGAGFLPATLDLKMVDRIELAGEEEAIEMSRRLAKEEGILSGISCGAAVAAAVRVAKTPEMKGKTIVVILPDSGERYLSSVLFDGIAE